MTPRERVMAVFDHRIPDRIPAWCGASPEFMLKARNFLGVDSDEKVRERLGDDFRRVHSFYAGPDDRHPLENLPRKINSRTIFNVLREGYEYGYAVNHPLKDGTLEDLETYPWPDPAWLDISTIRDQAAAWNNKYAILGGEWCPFWHDAIDLVGMEELLIRMYTDSEFVSALMTRITDYYIKADELLFSQAGDVIDIHFIGNDLGSQTGPLIGPEQFRQFLLPSLERIAAHSHSYGLKVMLHCCGGYEPHMDDLIAVGIDSFQALQPDAAGMDPSVLKEKYGSRVILNGGVDSHHVLIKGTPETSRDAVREAMTILKPGGNFILSPSHDYLLEETPVENVLAMYETLLAEGAY